MGWFSEQIRQKTESDRKIVEDSFFNLAGAVLGRQDAAHLNDQRLMAGDALNDVLKTYHLGPVAIPDGIQDVMKDVDVLLSATGLMAREVRLGDHWQRTAYGPMLGTLQETGTVVALLPGTVSGYHYIDPESGKKIRITARNEQLLAREAICFYRPLPRKKLGIPDLLLYMKTCISAGDVILIVLAALAATLVGMIEPRVYSLVTGTILKNRNMNLLTGMMVFLLSSAFAAQMISLIRSLLLKRISTKTSQAVQASVMMRILSLPVSFFRKYSSGDLYSRASSVDSLCETILNSILSVGLSGLMSLLYITQIFDFAPALVWPSLLITLTTVIISLAASIVQIDLSRKEMKLSAEEQGLLYPTLNGLQKIRMAGAENRFFARWANLYAKKALLEYHPPSFLKLNSVLITGISLAGTILLYFLAVQNGVAVNQYYAFSAAFGRVSAAFTALAGIAASAASIRPILEMADPILKAEPEGTDEKNLIDHINGRIEMSHVSFRYSDDTPYVLNDLSLSVKAGEYIAIVGRTGCGKSTLVRLLLGFEKPNKGAVYYDNYDLASLDPCSLRKHIGVVIQNGELFQGDIFSNITISAPQLTMDEAWEAAEIAGIAQDIREMPMGMQTMISEGQGGISGGQKQRLLIARAVAPKPRILIFDEATSALDNKTQRQVSEALDRLKCTRIVIAHRLSTVRNCDRILVMDQGAIIEEGNYDELIQRNGRFAELVARQQPDWLRQKEPQET